MWVIFNQYMSLHNNHYYICERRDIVNSLESNKFDLLFVLVT